MIVVALHVLVIGGIFIFEGCSRANAPAPEIAGNESLPGSTNLASTLPSPTPIGSEGGLTAATSTPAPVAPVAPVAPIAPTVPAKTYVVKKGDSLWKIAKAEKVTVDELCKANNLSKTSILKLNQKLTVPAASPRTEIAATAPAPVSGGAVSAIAPISGGNQYEVQIGDSLWKIAKNQGVTVTALKSANNLKGDKLQVGQKLTIPAKTTTVTAKATPAVGPAPAMSTPAPGAVPSVTSPGASSPVTATPPPGAGPAVATPGIVLN
jgi:LysM repeat protein